MSQLMVQVVILMIFILSWTAVILLGVLLYKKYIRNKK